MEKLVEMGLVKSIGISNFTTKKVAELLEFAKIKPACNQGKIRNMLFLFCFLSPLYTIMEHLNITSLVEKD